MKLDRTVIAVPTFRVPPITRTEEAWVAVITLTAPYAREVMSQLATLKQMAAHWSNIFALNTFVYDEFNAFVPEREIPVKVPLDDFVVIDPNFKPRTRFPFPTRLCLIPSGAVTWETFDAKDGSFHLSTIEVTTQLMKSISYNIHLSPGTTGKSGSYIILDESMMVKNYDWTRVAH